MCLSSCRFYTPLQCKYTVPGMGKKTTREIPSVTFDLKQSVEALRKRDGRRGGKEEGEEVCRGDVRKQTPPFFVIFFNY